MKEARNIEFLITFRLDMDLYSNDEDIKEVDDMVCLLSTMEKHVKLNFDGHEFRRSVIEALGRFDDLEIESASAVETVSDGFYETVANIPMNEKE